MAVIPGPCPNCGETCDYDYNPKTMQIKVTCENCNYSAETAPLLNIDYTDFDFQRFVV